MKGDTREQIARLRELKRQKYSDQDAGLELGLSPRQVYRLRQQYHIKGCLGRRSGDPRYSCKLEQLGTRMSEPRRQALLRETFDRLGRDYSQDNLTLRTSARPQLAPRLCHPPMMSLTGSCSQLFEEQF